MTLRIERAAVLGAGVMGAQIAAHLAAAGVRTHLLDLTADGPPPDAALAKRLGKSFRSWRAVASLESLKTLKPSPLMSASVLGLIVPGNFDDDMSVLSECDWVIEVVAERLEIKEKMLARMGEVVRPGVPITTNTSGILLKQMSHALPESHRAYYFGTHFFNPPRYMKLLEIIPGPDTDPKIMADLSRWIEARLGKGIVEAHDTINFIANRVGTLSLQATLKHMADLKLDIATVDALTGKLMGRPSSATFRTLDVVGLDTYSHVAGNVRRMAPQDPFISYYELPQWLQEMIQRGHLGQKGQGLGCYQKVKGPGGKSEIHAFDVGGGSYRLMEPEKFAWMDEAAREGSVVERLRKIFTHQDRGALLIWRSLRDTWAYAATLCEEIAGGRPLSIDRALQWGFNWELGPFALWQGLGVAAIRRRMEEEGVTLPKTLGKVDAFYEFESAPESADLANPARQWRFGRDGGRMEPIVYPVQKTPLPKGPGSKDRRVVKSEASGSLVDLGDGVACLVFHSKMNALGEASLALVQDAVQRVRRDFAGMVIANEGEHFSAGANLKEMLAMIESKDWDGIDRMIRNFQGALQLVKFAPFPTVACPHGLTLGGGCEVALQTDRQLLAAETYMGLVEVGVGLLPAGGGTKELALRAYDYASMGERCDPMPFLQRAFGLIGMAKTSTSGHEAIEMGLMSAKTADVSLSRDHQVARAKGMVLERVGRGYVPAVPRADVKVVGDPGLQTFRMALYNMVEGRQISEHDAWIGERIARVLCGGDVDAGTSVDEAHLLLLERQAFVELCRHEKSQARIAHMLKTGKPLRN